MERESFEDEEVAQLINRYFVPIKVDREERPDIDGIYMDVCQALTGSGGWPLTIFMTSNQKAFFAGTYFPKNDRMGMPGLMSILNRVAQAWQSSRKSIIESGEQIVDALKESQKNQPTEIPKDAIDAAYRQLERSFDSVYGGFGTAPKFPSPHNLLFLLRYWSMSNNPKALLMVEKTLDSMYRGGIFDHIGLGFSRYSTDRKWLIPHFEKMLYDNALLSMAYLEAFQATGKKEFSDAAKKIFTYVLRDMTSRENAFYCAEDADSEGEEGRFYVWTSAQVGDILGEKDGGRFCKYYNITPAGNFEGKNIPNLINGDLPQEESVFFEECRQKLFSAREKRVHPYKDDKILTGWNALMIAALAMGGRVLGDTSYTGAAEKAMNFIVSTLTDSSSRLYARFRDGEAAYPAYSDDYAYVIWSLIELYESTYNSFHLEMALKYSHELLSEFWDEKNGGLYLYGKSSEQLVLRPKEAYDGAVPSGNSVSAFNFLRLAHLTGKYEFEEYAEQILKSFGSQINNAPGAYCFMLISLLYMHSAGKDIVIAECAEDNTAKEMERIVREKYSPFNLSILLKENDDKLKNISPFLQFYKCNDRKTTTYVCRHGSCMAPVTETKQLKNLLEIN